MSDKDNIAYTDLQKREIDKLTHRIKEKHEPTTKNIGPISSNMVYILHHDEELQSVYNKKTVIMGSLYELYGKKTETLRHIAQHEQQIDKQIRQEGIRPTSSCCRRSFTPCIIT